MKRKLSLRQYLIAVFLPLAIIPLGLQALLGHVFLGRALDQEILRRAKPELSALSLDLEKIEESLGRALKAQTDLNLNELLGKSLFDELRIFDENGNFQKNYESNSETISAKMRQLLQVKLNKGQLSLQKPGRGDRISRNPANQNFFSLGSRFESPQRRRLALGFRRFLKRGELWSLKEVSYRKLRLEFVFYKTLVAAKRREFYVEGRFFLDAAKIKVLAQLHGTESFMLSPEGNFLAASFDYRKWQGPSLDLDPTKAQNRQLLGKDFSFFLSPIEDERESPWMGVGISRSEANKLQRTLLGWTSVFVMVLAVGLGLLIWMLASKLTRPMAKLIFALEQMREGIWIEPLEAQSQKDMAYLTHKFNEMVERVQNTQLALEQKLKELALAQDQLVQSAKLSSLGQLVAGVAHELNNPIAFIYANMSQLRTYLKSFEEMNIFLTQLQSQISPREAQALQEFLVRIEWHQLRQDLQDIAQSSLEGSVRVKDIVLGLRNFSRLDEHRFETSDVHVLLRNSAKLLQHEWRDRVQLDWNLCSAMNIPCHPSQLNQVFVNLLANAFQAMSHRGQVEISTAFVELGPERWAEIRIRDNGHGIAPEHLAQIFDPFFTTKKVGDGTGLGLSIVYGIIQKHGGRIEVQSWVAPQSPTGTEFRILLPCAVSSGEKLKQLAS